MNAPRSGCPRQPPSLPRVADRSEERIASNILADRLRRLEKAGLVSRRDDPCLDNRILLMRQTKTAAVSRIPHFFFLRSALDVTEDRSPPVGFWEAEGPFVTINAVAFIHSKRLNPAVELFVIVQSNGLMF
jgi:hypothetical protein